MLERIKPEKTVDVYGHVTLMRAADVTSGTLPAPAHAEGRIARVTLFQSDLSGPRPAYTPLHVVELPA